MAGDLLYEAQFDNGVPSREYQPPTGAYERAIANVANMTPKRCDTEVINIDDADWDQILALAQIVANEARRLNDWADDRAMDETGGELLIRAAERWLALESVLADNGIVGHPVRWYAWNDDLGFIATCFRELADDVRKKVDWFKFLPCSVTCLQSLAPKATMGMPHRVFERRLGVAIELLQKVISSSPQIKGKPGRRGYPNDALTFAKQLRVQHPTMTVGEIRRKCLEKFPEHSLPAEVNAFRAWLNRRRIKRTI